MRQNIWTTLALFIAILGLLAAPALAQDAAVQDGSATIEEGGPISEIPADPCAGLDRYACPDKKCGTGAYDYCVFSNGKCRNPCGGVSTAAAVPDPTPVPKDPCAGLSNTTCGNAKCGSGSFDYCIFSNGKCRNPCGGVSTAAVQDPGPTPAPKDPCAGLSNIDCQNAKCGSGPTDNCVFSNGRCKNPCTGVILENLFANEDPAITAQRTCIPASMMAAPE